MTDEQKAKRGRPAKPITEAYRARIVFMTDDAMLGWLNWHSAEAGVSVAEVIRRAVTAYRSAQS